MKATRLQDAQDQFFALLILTDAMGEGKGMDITLPSGAEVGQLTHLQGFFV